MKTICVKIGGSTVDAAGLLEEMGDACKQLVLGGDFPVVIHGGGKDIAKQLGLLNKEFTFVEGQRVTDAETMSAVQMVLSGDVNKRIVNKFLVQGTNAMGLSGVDCGLFTATRLTVGGKDIGFVGDISAVHTAPLLMLRDAAIVPVVSPVSRDTAGNIYNVNADNAAAECAIALAADHLVYISDVPGVLVGGAVRRNIRVADIEILIAEGHVTGGMIPKLRNAAEVIERGAKHVHICQWRGPHTLSDEMNPLTAQGTVIEA